MNPVIENSPQTLTESDEFRFSCGSELACFNKCCRDVNIYLTPIDIALMRRALGISSGELLKTCVIPLFPKAIGHPVMLLKMRESDKSCPFTTDTGCRIYNARPWSCRSFPLEPADGDGFRIVKRDFCLGFDGGRVQKVSDWLDGQDMKLHEAVNNIWSSVTQHPAVDRVNLLDGPGRDVFFIGSYNPDEFRAMIFNSGFLNHFSVDEDTLRRVREDDIELIGFGVKWMRTVLFGEKMLARR